MAVERSLPRATTWANIGRWKPEVRPYTYNKKWIVSERIPSA